MKYRVLWIEDGAFLEASPLSAPLTTDGKYDLTVALNATDGEKQLLSNEFDVVIVDIRIPPGNDPKWIKKYNENSANKVQARLGMQLLYSMFKPSNNTASVPDDIGKRISVSNFGILSVEGNELIDEIKKDLGIKYYLNKADTRMDDYALFNLVELIINNKEKSITGGKT